MTSPYRFYQFWLNSADEDVVPFLGYGNILAARFVNQSDGYLAIRYVDRDGAAGYFNPTGESAPGIHPHKLQL